MALLEAHLQHCRQGKARAQDCPHRQHAPIQRARCAPCPEHRQQHAPRQRQHEQASGQRTLNERACRCEGSRGRRAGERRRVCWRRAEEEIGNEAAQCERGAGVGCGSFCCRAACAGPRAPVFGMLLSVFDTRAHTLTQICILCACVSSCRACMHACMHACMPRVCVRVRLRASACVCVRAGGQAGR